MRIGLGCMTRGLSKLTSSIGMAKQNTLPAFQKVAARPVKVPQFTARNYITATHKSTMAKGIVKAETVPSILTSGMATVALHKHDALNTIGAAKLFTSAAGDRKPTEAELKMETWKRDNDFSKMDQDDDGNLNKEEFAKTGFSVGDFDSDGDGKVSKMEWESSDLWRTERYAGPTLDGQLSLIGAHPGNYPTLLEAAQMQRHYYEMSNENLLLLSAMGNVEAAVERMIREVMVVDQVHWRIAARTVQDMEEYSGGTVAAILRLPYTMGTALVLGAAVASIPLCFSTPVAFWFNEHYVTADIPPPEDLETILETGAWTWNWMEPPLGAISFFLLCLQFARQQTGHMWKGAGAQGPWNAFLKRRRLHVLLGKYPQYDEVILKEYSYSLTARAGTKVSLDALNMDPRHRQMMIQKKLKLAREK